jgi:hypothetical protein
MPSFSTVLAPDGDEFLVDDSPTGSTAKSGRRVRATRSNEWKDMEEVKKVVGGKEVRVAATCNYFKSCIVDIGGKEVREAI